MTSWKFPVLFCGLLLAFPAFAAGQNVSADEEARLEFFEKKIRPLLVDNCFNCHSANTNSQSGLRVDDRNGLVVGGRRGPAVVPGQPEKSLIIQAVRKVHPQVKMPPKKELTEQEIANLTKWIKDGAAWPKPRVPAFVNRPNPEYPRLRKEHWAFQPLSDAWRAELRKQPVNEKWARDDIDRLLLVKMEAKGLKPVADADALTLIRRVTFDLTGLPPTGEEVNEFVAAWDTPGAKRQAVYEQLVDRLLASPRFGEQWGRHWLDLARFGESTGSARNLPYPHAWRYRDYVIDAFNKDTPYDQFIQQQLAGDLLPWKTQEQRDENLTATGFLAIGVRDVNQRFKIRFVMDNIDEQIDAVSRSMLALTVSCARCHDHKFDPIPTADYYALAGIFQSSDQCTALRNKMGGGGLDYYDPAKLLALGRRAERDPNLDGKIKEAKAALVKAQARVKDLVDNPESAPAGPERENKLTSARQQVKKIQAELISLDDPATQGPVAMGVREAKTVADCEIRIRGEAEKIGPTVPRGFLTAFEVPGAAKVNPQRSGRLELAQWLTSDKNPLTSRVIVNRVWHHLFGQGIVASVDNFGVTGEKPANPELLDHLAMRFMQSEPEALAKDKGKAWSIKRLVRTIVLTHAYQLGAETPPANLKIDPANRLVWRHNPRRLTAEEIRDAMLLAAKKLDLSRPQGSAAMDLKVIEMTNTSALAKSMEEAAEKSVRRSIYLPLLRTIVPKSLEVFDFADQGLVTGSRDTTTVATQSLYLLNAPFVRQQSQTLAKNLTKASLDEHGRVSMAYQSTLGRPATEKELDRATRYIAAYEAAARKEKTGDPHGAAWASFCQALMASAEFRYIK